MDTKEIFLLRHGDTGLTGRYVGASDVDISIEGREQVSLLSMELKEHNFDQVFLSPMKRCRQTFDVLGLSCDVQVSDNLKEIDFGLWELKSFSEILKTDKDLIDNWVNSPATFSFPGGESIKRFRSRVATFSHEILKNENEKVLVISHGGVIRLLICIWLKISTDNYLLFDIKPGAYSKINLHTEGGVLTGLNLGG